MKLSGLQFVMHQFVHSLNWVLIQIIEWNKWPGLIVTNINRRPKLKLIGGSGMGRRAHKRRAMERAKFGMVM